MTLNPHFATTGNPYSEKLLESSPLNRVYRQAAPGDAWALNPLGNDHAIKFDYQTNEDEEVEHFYAQTTWNSSTSTYDIQLQVLDAYRGGELYKTITKDENWTGGTLNTTEEFKDKLGRVVLKRTYNTDGAYDTYYVYDDYGNLTYVIPPLVNTQDGVDSTELSELCYQYKYDYRNRLVEKKLPGKTWEYIVYDKLDRVSMTGPAYDPFGNQELGWMVTKYDAFGRVVYTGWYYEGGFVESQTRADYQSLKNNENGVPREQRVSSGVVDGQDIKYSNTFFPTQIALLSVNYYDDYDFPGVEGLVSDVQGQDVATNVKGLSTGGWVRVLTKSSVIFEKSTVLYDEKGRVIRTYKTNYQGGFHQTDVLLDFTGKVLESETTHRYNANATPVTVLEQFTYSPQDRLLTLTHQINQGHEEMIQNNEYDALGQLISKRVGGDYSQSDKGYQKIDYRYNIRGWLTDINEINVLNAGSGLFEDLFAFQIRYDNPDGHSNGNVSSLYNGNISETFWISNTDGVLRKYGYKYDPLNRLKDAYFQRPYSINPVCSSYDEYLSYDKNGNILSLIRNGHLESVFQPNLIDELEYFYQGNRLTRVTDHSENPNGFKDDENNTNDPDYLYDDFGNMIHDENKKIELIQYNHLNLPTSIVFGTGAHITYLYNAAGQKLRKTVFDGPPLYRTSITEYLDGFQYNNEVLQFFSHPEGYVLNTPDSRGLPSYDYVYQYKDHLGNIRLNFVFDSDAADLKVLEENHYYPFGLKHENYNVTKKNMKWESELIGGEEMELKRVRQVPNSGYQYKFGGNEFQNELELNVYDYDNRIYEPAIGRFWQMDPLSENGRRWSPYNYCFDNPIYFQDPDGMWPFPSLKDVKNFASGVGTGVKNFVPNAVNHLKSEAKGLVSAYKNLATNPNEAVKYAVNHSGPVMLYNAVKTQVETPVKIIKSASKGDYKKAGEAYGNHLASGVAAAVTEGAVRAKSAPTIAKTATAETPATNPVPPTLARVIPAEVEATTLGAKSADRVFVTNPNDISGLNAAGIADKLTIPESPSGFQVIEFPTPTSGIATPIQSNSPGFIGGGQTAGGATEFTIPNQTIPSNATTKIIQ